MQEVLGYLSMFIALLFIFFGIRNYRDTVNNGSISFGRALGLGVLIALIPALCFGIFDAIYVAYLNPDFFDNYMAEYVAHLPKDLNAEQLSAKISEMEQMKEMASNPIFNFFLMFFTVLPLGFIVSLISATILRKSEPGSK